MTRDEIIKMAREADANITSFIDRDYGEDVAVFYMADLERFARAAYKAGAAAERERIKAERHPHLRTNGCPVCGIATTAYACSRGDCPTRITCTFL